MGKVGKSHLIRFGKIAIFPIAHNGETTDMAAEIRVIDTKGRVSLPKGFANSTVVIEQISDSEVRIRKARVIPENELRFQEESMATLSDRDRDRFLNLLDKPPKANKALKKAVARHRARHG
jgi:hypothetical protein